MLCLIGNSPSSGSTFFADIIDSPDFSICGPELELFSSKEFYDWQRFKKNYERITETPAVCTKGIFPHYHRFVHYGWNRNQVFEAIKESDDLHQFIEKFKQQTISFRGKEKGSLLFEKTPQNLNVIGEFLEAFPKAYFVILVRHPLYVYRSLIKRGFGNLTAISTWLIDCAMLWRHLDHPRVKVMRYEDLVLRPYEMVLELFEQIDSSRSLPSAEDLETLHNENQFREQVGNRIQTWQVKSAKKVTSANSGTIDAQLLEEFKKVVNCRVDRSYAAHYKLPAISFREALERFNYHEEDLIRPLLKNATAKLPHRESADIKLSKIKWLRSVRNRPSNFFALKATAQPLELC